MSFSQEIEHNSSSEEFRVELGNLKQETINLQSSIKTVADVDRDHSKLVKDLEASSSAEEREFVLEKMRQNVKKERELLEAERCVLDELKAKYNNLGNKLKS